MFYYFKSGHKHLNLIILGFFVYYVGGLLYGYFFNEAKWTYLVYFIGAMLLWISYLYQKKSLNRTDNAIAPIIWLFLVVCAVYAIIGTPICLYIGRGPELLVSKQLLWMFLIGFTVLIPISLKDIVSFIEWSKLYVLSSLFFSLFFIKDIFVDSSYLISTMIGYDGFLLGKYQEPAFMMIPICAFFIFFMRFTKIWRFIIIVSFIMALSGSLLGGRRSISLILFGYALMPLFILFSHKIKYLLIGLSVLLFVYLIVDVVSLDIFDSFASSPFEVLYNRYDIDTRSGIEDDFISDMDGPVDWFFGRGMNGTYKSTAVSDIDLTNRVLVETGYLNIILHGGILTLILYVCILIYAFIQGFFRSHSLFVKSCAVFILYHLFMLYPMGTPYLTLEYFLLFVFVRICITKQWRRYNDQDINYAIFKIEDK